MKSRLIFLGWYGLFWYLYFLLVKLIFLFYHFPISKNLPFYDWVLILIHGSWLDVSTTGYILVIPGFVVLSQSLGSDRFTRPAMWVYTVIVLFIVSFLAALDFELYGHWGYRLDKTPVQYLMTGADEVVGQTDPLLVIRQVLLMLAIIAVSLFFYTRVVDPRVKLIDQGGWRATLVMFFTVGALFIPIRGGFGVAPMNVGFVYFHKDIFPNHAAINTVWNFGYSLAHFNEVEYPNDFMDPEITKSLFKPLHQDSGSTLKILNQEKPNVLMIILEGFTSKIIEPLGGLSGITPNLNRLMEEGVLFSNIYSSGYRTDQGVIAIISGFPSQPTSIISKFPAKTQNLPFLSHDFKNMGYHANWTFGYNIDYANFNSYLHLGAFEDITEKNDFEVEDYVNSKWGVDDHKVFNQLLEQINDYDQDEPFFWVGLTLSSHEPFKVPMETVIEGDDDVSLFLNSAYYTDQSLGNFINEAKQQEWWSNTLVVITADHGTHNPGGTFLSHDFRKFKIPLLLLGGAVARQDTVIETYGSQTDIANTLLAQFDKPNPEFLFSKNLLSTDANSFAFYTFNDGFVYQSDKFRICYDAAGDRFFEEEGERTARDREVGKAYLQTLYTDFNNK